MDASPSGIQTERFTAREADLIRQNARLRGRCSGYVTFLQGLGSSLPDGVAKELIVEFLNRDKKEPMA